MNVRKANVWWSKTGQGTWFWSCVVGHFAVGRSGSWLAAFLAAYYHATDAHGGES